MKRAKVFLLLVGAALLAMPTSAYAVTDELVVPGWLSYAAGLVGLAICVLHLVNAYLLRRVADGSMIADSIVYMMLGVVCLASSVLVRWSVMLAEAVESKGFIYFAADLLMTAGMALFAAYFIRLRIAMTRYLRSVEAYKQPAGTDEEQAVG